jgi:hypothetical protein
VVAGTTSAANVLGKMLLAELIVYVMGVFWVQL